MSETAPDELLELIEKAEKGPEGLPPVHKWEPDNQKDIDMRIARDGSWYYQDSPIRREKMVRLFSTVLRRDGDDYFLVTPVEKLGIQVDDAPFVATSVEPVERDGETKLLFTTNLGDAVLAGPDHPIEVTESDDGEPAPYVHIRHNLWALIARPVFYRLVEMGDEVEEGGGTVLVVDSGGERFFVGRY